MEMFLGNDDAQRLNNEVKTVLKDKTDEQMSLSYEQLLPAFVEKINQLMKAATTYEVDQDIWWDRANQDYALSTALLMTFMTWHELVIVIGLNPAEHAIALNASPDSPLHKEVMQKQEGLSVRQVINQIITHMMGTVSIVNFTGETDRDVLAGHVERAVICSMSALIQISLLDKKMNMNLSDRISTMLYFRMRS